VSRAMPIPANEVQLQEELCL